MGSAFAIPPDRQPRHIAIIMDGNGRWARRRHLPRIEGHRRGAESVRRVIGGLEETSVTHLTLYAFSVENWGRPEDEVKGLMNLLLQAITRELKLLLRHGIRLQVIGRTAELPGAVRQKLAEALETTADCQRRTLTVALNYGSRSEMIDAVNLYTRLRDLGEAPRELASWEDFAPFLYTRDLPDPDLVIRTSGEQRVSNFLLLQGAYAEYYFTDVLWPDFREEHLYAAITAYANRERRFGKTGAQVRDTGADLPATLSGA